MPNFGKTTGLFSECAPSNSLLHNSKSKKLVWLVTTSTWFLVTGTAVQASPLCEHQGKKQCCCDISLNNCDSGSVTKFMFAD
mmetsp:Transcript_2020/g.3066  ORF Transcript_2020/g.3066 Transcript_2020/m.3066 type:complete len:82 (+) Transcript_2020:92-337(+)